LQTDAAAMTTARSPVEERQVAGWLAGYISRRTSGSRLARQVHQACIASQMTCNRAVPLTYLLTGTTVSTVCEVI